MKPFLLAPLLVCALSTPAFAADGGSRPQNVPQAATAPDDDDDDKMVCTRERTIGSNRLTRVCRTEAQIRAERERAREDLQRNQTNMGR